MDFGNLTGYIPLILGSTEAQDTFCKIPCQLVSDNGPLFVAAEFQNLTKEWDIEDMVTSPTKVKRMDRLRQQSSLLRNCSARLLKTATIFTWDFLRYAILNHRVLAVAPLNGS